MDVISTVIIGALAGSFPLLCAALIVYELRKDRMVGKADREGTPTTRDEEETTTALWLRRS